MAMYRRKRMANGVCATAVKTQSIAIKLKEIDLPNVTKTKRSSESFIYWIVKEITNDIPNEEFLT